MKEAPAPPRTPRPLFAFFLSLGASAFLLGLVLFTDGRVFELKKARAEILRLDAEIADRRRENEELRGAIESARRQEFPAEKVAREELHLVHPEDLVLLYPRGSLSPEKKTTPGRARQSLTPDLPR